MANPYNDLTARLVTELTAGLTSLGYTPLAVRRGIWKPRALEPFDRYLIFISPPATDPVRERVISAREFAFELKAQLFLLVKNYNEDQSVFGDVTPNFGVFDLVNDVKTILRGNSLSGLLNTTYRETEGGSGFESGASTGFSSGSHEFVHRASLTFTGLTKGFCI